MQYMLTERQRKLHRNRIKLPTEIAVFLATPSAGSKGKDLTYHPRRKKRYRTEQQQKDANTALALKKGPIPSLVVYGPPAPGGGSNILVVA